MAITKAQQARQMLKRGSKKPVKQAGATNYLGKQEMVTAPKFWLSEPGHVKAKLAYITDEEEKILIDKNLYGSLKGKPNIGPAGLPSLQGGDFGAGGGGQGPDRDGPEGPAGGASAGGDYGGNVRADQTYGGREFKDQSYASQQSINRAKERQKQRDKAAAARAKEIAQAKKEAEKFKRIQKQKAIEAKKAKDLSDLGKKQIADDVMERRKRMGAKRILEQIPGTPEYEEAEKDDIASGAIMDLFVNDPKTRSNLGIGTLKALEPILDSGAIKTRGFFADDVLSMDPKRFERNFGLTPEEFRNASLTRQNEIYGRYMDDRLSNRTDAFGNPIGGAFRDSQGNIVGGRDGPDNQIIPPIVPTTTGSVTSEEEVDNRSELEKLIDARGPAYRFFADGGRVPAQQGGIMFRLNELGSGVSSAEEMLQQINQRLDSAESSLGGDGGVSAMGPSGFNTNFNQQSPPFSPIQNSVSNFDPNKFASFNSGFNSPEGNKPRRGLSIEDSPFAGPRDRLIVDTPRGPRRHFDYKPGSLSIEDNRFRNPLGDPVGPRNRIMELQERFNRMSPDDPRRILGYKKDGGRAGYNVGGMADDDDPVGGIMDLESGRQMYFLGKLVKKVTRSVKKIAKSPVGKLALGAAALKFGSPFLKSEGLKNFFFKGGKMGLGNLTQRGLLTGILGTSALAGLMTPKQEEEEQEPYLGPGIDIPAIRRDPYGAMGGAYSFYAEGGKAEPVAKKTMPLLDMDGMEKDYRETGGFVEMGRMERADDVPARLSKNEFVFTADAVRNAGDGDIDKGAEVMYNMMKNLESGGEVSEESQGLEGARKMFQTSQRLGEVI